MSFSASVIRASRSRRSAASRSTSAAACFSALTRARSADLLIRSAFGRAGLDRRQPLLDLRQLLAARLHLLQQLLGVGTAPLALVLDLGEASLGALERSLARLQCLRGLLERRLGGGHLIGLPLE